MKIVTIDLKGKQSILLPLEDMCKKGICPMLTGQETKERCRSFKQIGEVLNRKILSELLNKIKAFEDCNRVEVLDNNLFWSKIPDVQEKFEVEADKLKKEHVNSKKIHAFEPLVTDNFANMAQKDCESIECETTDISTKDVIRILNDEVNDYDDCN